MEQNETLHALQITIEGTYDVGSYLKPGAFDQCLFRLYIYSSWFLKAVSVPRQQLL